jgi:transposase
MEGTLRWDWTSDMKAESIAPVLKKWEEALGSSLEAIVWDGAKGHQGSEYDEVEISRIQQPPYSPELQPAERVFEYLRARIEGIVYGELEAKKEAVESELRKLAACPEKVRSLTCWDWIEKALAQLSDR